MPDESLADQIPDNPDPNPFVRPAPVETVLDLDEVMSSARLTERTVRICLRADLQRDYDAALDELSELVDTNGNVLSTGDASLADGTRAEELSAKLRELHTRMGEAMRAVRFRAMPDDEWRTFTKKHGDAAGRIKDKDAFDVAIIARCAVEPTLSVDQVRALGKKLAPTQMDALATGALRVNEDGGVDIPKLPGFSAAPTPPTFAPSSS